MLPPGAIIVVSLSLPVSLANARIEVSSTTFETLLIINRADNPIRSLIPSRGFFLHKNMRQGTVPEVKKTRNQNRHSLTRNATVGLSNQALLKQRNSSPVLPILTR